MSRPKIRTWLLVITVLALLSTLAACGGNALLGKWEDPDGVGLELKSDGTFTIGFQGMSINGTFEQKGDQLTLTATDLGDPISFTYAVSGDTMTLTDADGTTTQFTRVK